MYLQIIYSLFKNTDTTNLLAQIKERINQFQLSQTNRDGFNALRTEYNQNRSILDLFVLSCYSFNHQIRFNSKHEFNTPFGKDRSSFNDSIEKNLLKFCTALQNKNIIFSTQDFRKFDYSRLSIRDFVYCDPPYLISTGSYNDGKRGFQDWTQKEDQELLDILDSLNERNISFALSNVFEHKGMENTHLIEWSKKYNTIFIDKEYSNCSYHFKDRKTKTVEVIVTNFSR